MSAAQVSALVERELHSIAQLELAALARRLAIPPRLEHRSWDYGPTEQYFPCWLVVEHLPSNTGIAYCAQGFGPSYPWGLVSLSGEHMSMGSDGAWFVSLEDALRNSSAWQGQNPAGYEAQ